jgi:hypothetical protein
MKTYEIRIETDDDIKTIDEVNGLVEALEIANRVPKSIYINIWIEEIYLCKVINIYDINGNKLKKRFI